jgi:hypothetical protein
MIIGGQSDFCREPKQFREHAATRTHDDLIQRTDIRSGLFKTSRGTSPVAENFSRTEYKGVLTRHVKP